MKISTWNVNSIKARIEHLSLWLDTEKPDIVLLQELKCINEAFPRDQIEDLGYNIAIHGQKTYNGVAILSKMPLSDIITDFPNNPIPDEARYIEAFVNLPNGAIRVASVYVPNGQDLFSEKYQIKLKFLDALADYYQSLTQAEEMLVIGGDLNIAIAEEDVYNPALLSESICFSGAERRMLRKFISTGLIDAYRMINHTISHVIPDENKLFDRGSCENKLLKPSASAAEGSLPRMTSNSVVNYKKWHHIDEGYTWWDYRAGAFNKNNGMRIDYLFCSPEVAHISKDCYTLKSLRAAEKPSDHIPVTMLLDI